MKPLRKIVGYALVAAPIVGIFAVQVHYIGWRTVAISFAVTAAIIGVFCLGLRMIKD